jgi:hypothetical protein
MNAPLPTPQTIVVRMEKASPDERRAALFECAKDVGRLYRLKQIKRREANEWATALQLWGQRRAGLTWSQASEQIIRGLRERHPNELS